jgi:hypothetical protein
MSNPYDQLLTASLFRSDYLYGSRMLVEVEDGRDQLCHPNEAGIAGMSTLPGEEEQV